MNRFAIALLAALALAGCSSLNMTTANNLRALDYANDDIASLLIAFDVPETLEPIEDGSQMIFTVGADRLVAVLERADFDAVEGTLPPPSGDRTYYLFGFSDADKAKIRSLQAAARANPGNARSLSVALSPAFCRTEEIDPNRITFSVLLALPGVNNLQPLFQNANLAQALSAAPQKTLPACAGHSG